MIDVVVPVYGQLHLVAQCLDTLKAQEYIGRIIVVDDCSPPDGTSEYLDIADVTVIRNAENRGFVESVNAGMELVESEYAVIVNSDTSPVDGDSLYTLVRSAYFAGAAVAGARLLFMPGSNEGRQFTIQHAGVAFDPDGVPYHPFMHLHADTRAANRRMMVTAVTGAVFCVHTDTWRELDGFDTEFSPGVYEDVDYCLRAKKVLYEPQSVWLHMMHGSGGGLFDHAESHLKKLLSRWGRLESDEHLYYGV